MRKLNLLGAQATDASMEMLAGMEHLQVVNLYRTQSHELGCGAAAGTERADRCRPALQPRDFQRRRSASDGPAEFQSAIQRLLDGAAEDRRRGPPSANTDRAIADWVQALGGKADFAGSV